MRAPEELLTVVTGRFEARVVEARLRAEGLDVHLRGSLDDPYVFTVGAHAGIEVWVPADQVADASFVLLADEIDETMDGARDDGWWDDDAPDAWVGTPTQAVGRPRLRRWLVGTICTLVVIQPLVHIALGR